MSTSQRIVFVIGGAVAGSEAVQLLRDENIRVVCFEQNALPYGKIEDGLPRWHAQQRIKESIKIDERLNHPLVSFVPNTKIGVDVSLEELLALRPSAILFANGAWRDRPLPVSEVDKFQGRGFVYQNPFVWWFNHYEEPGYAGYRYIVPDGALVIGGGLASLDVLKICQLEVVKRVLSEKGHDISILELEKEGIDKSLEKLNLRYEQLGIKGATLYFRRKVEDMSLAELDPKATEEQKSKVGHLREKILNNYKTKFRFNVVTEHVPVRAMVAGDRMVGMVFAKTQLKEDTMETIPDSEQEVLSDLVISSIGSIPEPIPGIPMRGERYDIQDWTLGAVRGVQGVFILGNALTGKGNIRVSMMHSREVIQKLLAGYLSDPSCFRSAGELDLIQSYVRRRQEAVGCSEDYLSWIQGRKKLV